MSHVVSAGLGNLLSRRAPGREEALPHRLPLCPEIQEGQEPLPYQQAREAQHTISAWDASAALLTCEGWWSPHPGFRGEAQCCWRPI